MCSPQSAGIEFAIVRGVQAKDATELLQTLRGRLESSEAHRRALEESLQETRSAAARSEERVTAVGAEIRKGNQIIEKLQTELRCAHPAPRPCLCGLGASLS